MIRILFFGSAATNVQLASLALDKGWFPTTHAEWREDPLNKLLDQSLTIHVLIVEGEKDPLLVKRISAHRKNLPIVFTGDYGDDLQKLVDELQGFFFKGKKMSGKV